MNEIDVSKYFKLFDDGCYYFMADMNDELYEDILDHNEQLQQLKAENERLQAELDSYAKMKKVFGMNKTGLQQWVDMYNKADKERFDALLQRDKYKQCLDEIEEICKNECEYNCSYDNSNCEVESCLERRIQAKIKEVKE